MYTVISGKYEGFTYDEDIDALECADVDEVDAVINEMRFAGYRIFIIRKDGVDVARVDDIAAAIIAQDRVLSTLE
ncbi:hypothetical protein NSS79_10650 [Paenibacillus sp. FSL L8-0436]|uniref:hypothetical protein n=1 Tax=Paenibacillus sp. FSL L8-0436 TaxID=2954686 RepID=UPI003158DE94